jgi:Zn-dependent protease with chaperone function
VKRALRLGAFALAAGAWGTAAVLLWESSVVPGGLELSGVDPHRYFSDRQLTRTASFERFERWDLVLSQVAVVAVLVAYARWGVRFARESAAGRIGTGMLLGMLGLGFVWLSQIPFGLAGLWWERRHGVSKAGYVEWLFTDWAQLAGEFAFVSLALLIVMALAGKLRERWWIPGAVTFVALGAFFAFVQPYLLGDLHRLPRASLAQAAHRIAAREGVTDVPVRVEEVSGETSAANAMAVGLGPSRRVVLWDTLLDGRFGDRQIEFVIAHEYGHQARKHIPKGIAWYALFALPGAYLIARLTRRRGGMADPAAVPFSLLVLVALQLAGLPLTNLVTRHIETEADWMALRTTHDPAADRRLMQSFTRTSLVQPDPPTWSYVLLDDHPTIAQRIALANEWERRSR